MLFINFIFELYMSLWHDSFVDLLRNGLLEASLSCYLSARSTSTIHGCENFYCGDAFNTTKLEVNRINTSLSIDR